jgi:molybdate-binding protein
MSKNCQYRAAYADARRLLTANVQTPNATSHPMLNAFASAAPKLAGDERHDQMSRAICTKASAKNADAGIGNFFCAVSSEKFVMRFIPFTSLLVVITPLAVRADTE